MKLTFFSFREYLLFVEKNREWIDSITQSEAADLLGISRQRVSQLIDTGELDAALILREKFSDSRKESPTETNVNHVFLKREEVVLKSSPVTPKQGNPTKFFHNRFQADPEKLILEFKNSLSGQLLTGASHLHDFLTSDFDVDSKSIEKAGSSSIVKLLEMIRKFNKEALVPEPMLISVSDGMFLPATLLSQGLWSKTVNPFTAENQAINDDLQRWLFQGFIEWAPSLELNPPISSFFLKNATSDYPYLVGQYGNKDEAFSLPVLISSEQKDIEYLAEAIKQSFAFPASIKGLLIHKKHLPENEKIFLNNNNDFCIKISTKDHIIVPQLSRHKEQYSGYLWVCLGDIAAPTTVENSYFVWEHTDLANKDAIAYNLDSLDSKIEYIRNKNKDKNLSLLHKSMSIVRGKPAYEAEKFYDLLLKNLWKNK